MDNIKKESIHSFPTAPLSPLDLHPLLTLSSSIRSPFTLNIFFICGTMFLTKFDTQILLWLHFWTFLCYLDKVISLQNFEKSPLKFSCSFLAACGVCESPVLCPWLQWPSSSYPGLWRLEKCWKTAIRLWVLLEKFPLSTNSESHW